MSERFPTSMAGAVDLSSLAARRDAPAASPQNAAASAPVGVVVDVGDADFGSVIELSNTVPVIIDLWAEWCGPCKQLSPILERIVASYGGRMVLAKVDVDANPQLAQAFQAQSIPAVLAIIGGRPAPLFTGALPEAQVQEVLNQVLEFAAQQGINGSVPVDGVESAGEEAEPAEPPLPPLHQQAYDALDRGDHDAAIEAFEQAVTQNPRDREAIAGLAQVRLLARLAGATADDVRAAAAANPSDVTAQMAVVDLDITGGHVEDAFARMLDLVAATSGEERQEVRLRLLDLFEVVGIDDPRVGAARRRLTTLLY